MPRLAAQVLESAGTDFVGHFARFRITCQHRAQPFDEFLVTVGLVEGDEAVALHGTCVLLATLKLIDKANQVGTLLAPVSGELPSGIHRLVKNGRFQTAAVLDRFRLFDGMRLEVCPYRSSAVLRSTSCGNRLYEWMVK